MFYLKLIFITLPRLANMLGGSPPRAIFFYVRMIIFLLSKKISKSNSAWEFRLCFEGKPFVIKLFEGSTDIAALKEIFIDGEYDWDEIRDPKVIIDLGAHTGNTALYFHMKYPAARVYAIEASPKNYKFLEENTAHVPEITPVFCAITDRDGEVVFYESESSLGSSVHKRSAASREVRVPSLALTSLFKQLGIHRADFIKIDIEGGEEQLFAHEKPESFAPCYIVEVHDDLMEYTREAFLKNFNAFTHTLMNTPNPDRVLLRARQLVNTPNND